MRIITTAAFILSLLMVTACSTTNTGGAYAKPEVNYTSLADFLRRNSNVSVKGVDPDIRLQIRGVNSLSSETRPFIYINKNPLGRNYVQANNSVDPNNIRKVEVISSLSQLTRYGQEGHSGIIIILSLIHI